jgi:Na+-driven multidrug efflux pump
MWRYSLPLIFGGVLSTVITFMDGVFMAKYSINALNAIILVLPFVNLAGSIAAGLAVAATDMMGKERGGGNYDNILGVTLLLGVLLALVLIIAGYFLLPQITRAVGLLNSAEWNEEFRFFNSYWRWIVPSFLSLTLITVCIQVLVFFKRNRKANQILLVITLVNLLLNPLFIFGFNWGIKGAALATNLAYLSGLLMAFAFFRHRICRIVNAARNSILLRNVVPVFCKTAGKQLQTAGVVFLSISAFIVGSILVNKLCVAQGALAVSVVGISEQIKSLVVMPSRGVVSAYMIIFNKELLHKKTHNYYPVYWTATLLTGFIYGIVILVYLIFPGLVMRLYVNNPDPIFSNTFIYAFSVSAIVLFFSIFVRAAQVGFLNLGHSYMVFLHSVLQVAATWFFAKWFSDQYGVKGIIDGQLAATLIISLLIFIFYFFLLRRRIKKDRPADFNAVENA